MEDPLPCSSTVSAGETENQKQARLRRERRNAKIQAGGSARLDKITALNGSPSAPEVRSPTTTFAPPLATPPTAYRVSPANADDPDEVDISNMFAGRASGAPAQDPRDMFRQMLMSQEYNADGQPGTTPQTSREQTDDPIMRMMEQMMGGAGSEASGAIPPGLANMFGAGTPQQQEPADAANRIWRIVHAMCALLLAFYAVSASTFNGSKLARASLTDGAAMPQLFWMFTTIQLVLQSSRYFIDRGQLQVPGIFGTVASFLPAPYSDYLRMVARYGTIYTTIVSDAMIIIFVFGCMAWWNGYSA